MAIKLGEMLLKANLITEVQLKGALAEQAKWGGRLGEILVRMNYCSEEILCKALAKQLGLQRADLDNLPPIPTQVLRKIPPDLASDLNVLPVQLRDEGKTLVVAMAEPQNIQHIDTLRAKTGCRILALIAGPVALGRARTRLYAGEEEFHAGGEIELEDVKFTDAQGNTIVKRIDQIKPPAAAAAPPPPAVAPPPAPAPAPAVGASGPRPAVAGGSPAELLAQVEAVQRKEVAALKAMVEILIEKGVFTREEYLARVKR